MSTKKVSVVLKITTYVQLTVEAIANIVVNTKINSSNKFLKCLGLAFGSLATSANAISASTSKAVISELTRVVKEGIEVCNERDDRFESVRKNCVEFVAVELDRVEAALEDSAGCVFISEWLVFPFRVTGAVEQSIALVECAKKGGGNLGVVGGYE